MKRCVRALTFLPIRLALFDVVTSNANLFFIGAVAQHEIEKPLQLVGRLVGSDSQFLERLIEPIHTERRIAEGLRTSCIPSAESDNQYVLLVEMQLIHAQPIRAEGDSEDHTRRPEYYDSTFTYLAEIGFQTIWPKKPHALSFVEALGGLNVILFNHLRRLPLRFPVEPNSCPHSRLFSLKCQRNMEKFIL
jgi:hypothetical protein